MFATQPTALMDEMHVCILRVLAEDENKVLVSLCVMRFDFSLRVLLCGLERVFSAFESTLVPT